MRYSPKLYGAFLPYTGDEERQHAAFFLGGTAAQRPGQSAASQFMEAGKERLPNNHYKMFLCFPILLIAANITKSLSAAT